MHNAKLSLNFLKRTLISQTINKRHKSSSEYCLDLVKQFDYENFVCTILLKNSTRSCAIAVRSFNVEVARVAEQVSQQTIGLMRLKFWEDTLDKCFSKDSSKVPKHPVAQELFKVINQSKLTRRYFNNLLQSRREYFNTSSFKTLEDVEKYSEKTVSNIYYLILEGCDVRNVHSDHAASHLGKAQGITQQLRSIPHAKTLNFIPIPQDILMKHNLSQEDVLRSKSSKGMSDCVYEIATRAHQHLVKARNLAKDVPNNGKCALLPAVIVASYLDRLQKVDYDVFHPSLRHRSWKLLPQLWMSNWKNKY